jgi:hypothetical protein
MNVERIHVKIQNELLGLWSNKNVSSHLITLQFFNFTVHIAKAEVL